MQLGEMRGRIFCRAAYLLLPDKYQKTTQRVIRKTALGALNRGYKVTVVDDAILSQQGLSDILKKYEKDGIAAIPSKKLITM